MPKPVNSDKSSCCGSSVFVSGGMPEDGGMGTRYYICDNKLMALGWKEKTTWEEGLKKTIDWYLKNGFGEYWDNGNVEAALQPHPVMPSGGGAGIDSNINLGGRSMSTNIPELLMSPTAAAAAGRHGV